MRKGEMNVLTRDGDATLTWDVQDRNQVAAARGAFNRRKREGYVAFRLDERGRDGSAIDTFDPTAKRIVMSKLVIGG